MKRWIVGLCMCLTLVPSFAQAFRWSAAAERTLEQMLDTSGKVSVLTLNGRSTAPALSGANQARLYYDTASQALRISVNGGADTALGVTASTSLGDSANLARLDAGNVFTHATGQTISNTAPKLMFTDTTASAKGLTIAVDANVVDLRESAGAANSLLVLDLANNRVGVGGSPAVTFQVNGTSTAVDFGFPGAGAGTAQGISSSGSSVVVRGATIFLQGTGGAAGVTAISGNITQNAVLSWAQATPTIPSGFGVTPSVTGTRSAAFSVNVGTGGTASTGVIAMNATATTGWACNVDDITTPATNATRQTASSTTTVTVTNYARTTGIAAAWPASDIIQLACTAY